MTSSLLIAAGASFAVVAAMWWTYFEQARALCERALQDLADHRRRSNVARDVYTLGHLPVVAGIVVFAVGVEEAVLHPTVHLDTFGRLAIGLGLALFLLGVVADVFRASGRLQSDRVVAAVVVVVVLSLLGGSVSAITTMSIVAAVLIGACVVEASLTSAE
jgi:low temperature requirement protein LtrA